MKEYPTIPSAIRDDIDIYAFSKFDGSNIRAEWNKKKGFYKFGSRHRLLGADEKPLGEAISIVQTKYELLNRLFSDNRFESVVCFFEFFGAHSEFGIHAEEPHDVVLFDVAPYKKGILEPKEFIKLIDDRVEISPVLYYGKANQPFINQVNSGALPGMPFEGVVCKGKNDKKTKMPIMFKVKTHAWYEKLRSHCKGNETLFNVLK
jgi:hypothetical protein